MPYTVLTISDSTPLSSILDQIDSKLTLNYAGAPQGNVAAKTVGQLCYDTVNLRIYRCDATNGTIGGTTWTLVNSVPYATTAAPGAVELADAAEALAGVSALLVLTPSTAQAVYAKRSANLSDISDATAARISLGLDDLTNLGFTAFGILLTDLNNAHEGRSTLGGTAVGEAVFTAANEASARTSIGVKNTLTLDDASALFYASL